jgi:hypothetical protein
VERTSWARPLQPCGLRMEDSSSHATQALYVRPLALPLNHNLAPHGEPRPPEQGRSSAYSG